MIADLFMTWYADCIFNDDHFLTLGEEFKYHTKCQEINWDDKSSISPYPHTQETELQVQKIIDLQNVANNVPDAFTDYKCVMKSWNLVVNVPERVEIPKKTTQALSTLKRGSATTTKKDNASDKQPRKEKTKTLQKTVNINQLVVE
jgi:hypothetical protein